VTAIILNNSIYGIRRPVFADHALRDALHDHDLFEYRAVFKISELASRPAPSLWKGDGLPRKASGQPDGKAFLSRLFLWWKSSPIVIPSTEGRTASGGAVEMMEWQRDRAVTVEKAGTMKPEELKDKILIRSPGGQGTPRFPKRVRKDPGASQGRSG